MSRIKKELIKHQPSISTHSPIELEPGTACFHERSAWKCMENCYNQSTNQGTKSYWVKFPDNSILRRTRSMIKPQSQPSYFELEAEGKEWNNREHIPPHSHHPFNSNLSAPDISTLPVDNLVPQTLTSKTTLSAAEHIPVSSTSVTQPSITNGDPVGIPSIPRWSSWPNKGIPLVRFTPSKKWLCAPGTLWKPVERLFSCT